MLTPIFFIFNDKNQRNTPISWEFSLRRCKEDNLVIKILILCSFNLKKVKAPRMGNCAKKLSCLEMINNKNRSKNHSCKFSNLKLKVCCNSNSAWSRRISLLNNMAVLLLQLLLLQLVVQQCMIACRY